MYLELFLADFTVFRVFLGISQDFAEIPEFHGSATARNIRSPDVYLKKKGKVTFCSQGPFQCMPSVLRALVPHVTDATCNAV